MNGQRVFISVLIVALLLAVTVAGIQGQGSQPEVDAPAGNEPEADMDDVIPIQGRLTDDDGSPLNGSYSIRFGLYGDQTGGTVLCEDTDIVSVANGLFNAKMDFCTSNASTKMDARSVMIQAPSTNSPVDSPVPGSSQDVLGLSQEKTAYPLYSESNSRA
jgi:hypothetical protein